MFLLLIDTIIIYLKMFMNLEIYRKAFSSLISYMIQEGNADKYTVYIFIIWNIISHYYSYIYYITWKIGTRLHNTAIKEEFVDVKLPTVY